MQKFVLGADGGGTKLDMVLVSHEGRMTGRVIGGSSNYQVIGGQKLKQEIMQTAVTLMADNLVDPEQISTMYLGLAGAGREDCQNEIRELFEDTHFSGKVSVNSDAVAALAGAFGNRPGIILIAGTGSICFGMKEDGSVIRSGGWGYLLGDEGSSYYIGNHAIIAALKDLDGRGEPTKLRQLTKDRYELDSIDQIIPLIYQNKIERSVIADLAPVVFKAADEGDPVAQKIIKQTGRELGKLAKAVSGKIDFEDGKVRIALIGGIFSKRDILIDEIRKELSGDSREIQITDPEFKPSIGAAILALEKSGITISERLLKNLRDAEL